MGAGKEKIKMGMAKKDFERQEEERRHSGQFCTRCGSELTKDEVKYNENFRVAHLCTGCHSDWESMQKE